MARDDDPVTAAHDEAALAPFFAAARGAEPPPPVHLLSAILADAAAAQTARIPAADPARRTPRGRVVRLAAPVGGWRGVAALAVCAALGFWLGLAGEISIDGATVSAGTAIAESDDPVGEFFDLAAMEP
jgi:hypothetical protein